MRSADCALSSPGIASNYKAFKEGMKMQFIVRRENGIWYLNNTRLPSFADVVRRMDEAQKAPQLDRYSVGLHFTSEAGADDYVIGSVSAEDPKRAIYLAQIEAAESYGAQYETPHGGAYENVIWGEDEGHTHWLDTMYFRAAFIHCEKTGAHSVVTYDLEQVEFWGCENGEHL